MENYEDLLFSQFFYLRNEFNKKEDFFDTVLSYVINCKEFRDSPLSDTSFETIILGVVITPLYQDSYDSRFSIMYCLSDGVIHENRTMEGELLFNSDNVELIGNISRFNENGFIGTLELYQNFKVKNEVYLTNYDYGSTIFSGKEYISIDEFISAESFKKEKIKAMKSRINI